MNRMIHHKETTTLLFITFVLGCLALSPQLQAVNPPPDGGYPGQNTAEGDSALLNLYSGEKNTAVGFRALFANDYGSANTGVGANALFANTSGGGNTAMGSSALFANTFGDFNTAAGYSALRSNTTGTFNTATGYFALLINTIGDENTANGYGALRSNTTGHGNTAAGVVALRSNTTGVFNTANGEYALYANSTGHRNTADGVSALYRNTTGNYNTAVGLEALAANTTGSSNTVLGSNAGVNLTTGSGNVCIGADVLGVAGESNTTRIKNVYSSVASGRAVYVNSDNKIGTLASSRRFKNEIKPMDKASESILALKPVTFRYKKEIEHHGSIMFGLIAEEVEQVDPDLVTRNDKGEAEAVRYDAVNAMLLNEFLKEHRTLQELKRKIVALTATVKEQASQIQKVNAQLELNKPAPQTVLNDQ